MIRYGLFGTLTTLMVTVASGADVATTTRVTHGPILGRQGTDTMSLWVRTEKPGDVSVYYGTSENKLTNQSPAVRTQLEHDNTGVLTLSGLKPDTRYYYRVVDHQLSGSFKTMPRSTDYANEHNPDGLFNFSFEIGSCNNQNGAGSAGPTLPTFTTLNKQVRDQVLFAIQNGDWLYEYRREYPASAWAQQVGLTKNEIPRTVQLAPTIAGVWQNYKNYLHRGKNLSEWHRHVPVYFTYDDHETLNDMYGTNEAGYVNRRAVFRDIGVQAWFDYLAWANPVEHDAPTHFGMGQFTAASNVLVDPKANFSDLDLNDFGTLHVHWDTSTAGIKDAKYDSMLPGNPNSAVYRVVKVLDKHRIEIDPPAKATTEGPYSLGRRSYGKYTIGNCDFFLVDTRSHRDLHDVKNPAKPGVSMLGKQQFNWLKKGIHSSKADFIFVISSVTFMVPHVGTGGGKDVNQAVAKDDAWTVFLNEREELIEFWDKLDKPVFVMTGDLHNSFVVKITDNVWEFACGPHNSVNHVPEFDEADRPVNGPFKYGPRACEIRWSTYIMSDIPREHRMYPTYCVVKVNNVFNNSLDRETDRWVRFPKPQVLFQFYDGYTGDLRYSETIVKGQR